MFYRVIAIKIGDENFKKKSFFFENHTRSAKQEVIHFAYGKVFNKQKGIPQFNLEHFLGRKKIRLRIISTKCISRKLSQIGQTGYI